MVGIGPRTFGIIALAVTFLASSFMLSTWPSLGGADSATGEVGNSDGDRAIFTQGRLIVRLGKDIEGNFEAAQSIPVKVERIGSENSSDNFEPLSITELTNRRGVVRLLLPRGTFAVSTEVFEIGKQKVIDLNATSRSVFLEWIFHKKSISPSLVTFLDEYGNPSKNDPAEIFRVSYRSNIGQEYERLGFGFSDGYEMKIGLIDSTVSEGNEHLVLRGDVPIDISRLNQSVDASIIGYWVTTREVIR